MTKITKAQRFKSMGYREVQAANTSNYKELDQESRKFLKNHGYKNIGWEQVIKLYEKIEELLCEVSLEDLFLEADRIGNKYLTVGEINQTNQELAEVLNDIEVQIDHYFPDIEIKIIDFRKP
ncbi:hypothetical protein Syn7502_01926 [Synechococcus sp. PCC 7502]|uniref:hypothetical protein n=1 Tax=Synechococcus sp. PCC 7502 TaxID=1173263 RepID=UPI00029FFD04|nr:hypothetical protein [Synechococcus sp. PCC 7502]AFY73958.1 hypothetical protein Syn7502_01926 [Synechococcus sp. PCC 7502]